MGESLIMSLHVCGNTSREIPCNVRIRLRIQRGIHRQICTGCSTWRHFYPLWLCRLVQSSALDHCCCTLSRSKDVARLDESRIAGGKATKNVHYRNIQDHTETVAVEFDPDVVSYETLLKFFWTCESRVAYWGHSAHSHRAFLRSP